MAGYSRANVTSVAIMDIKRQTVDETAIIMTTETTIRLQESPASTGNSKTVAKEATEMSIVGQRKEKRKTT